jgi:2-oxoglutarate ferredoxin oxidoreductase subunit alpha
LADLTIRVGGEGGEGIISTGDFIAAIAAKAGNNILTFKTFPAEIKGGYAMYQTRISHDHVLCEGDGFEILVAFNGEAYEMNKKFLTPGKVFVYDGPGGDFEPEEHPGVIMYPVPMSKIAKEDLGVYRSKNMVCMGALSGLFDLDYELIKTFITNKFQKKGQEVVDINIKALDAGRDYCKNNLEKKDNFVIKKSTPKDVIIISGNDAAGLGGIAAGVEFFSCYPITPATEVAYFTADHIYKTGGTLVQAEDEIASIANVIGASYAGKRSMTATSGPGISLMSELIGMSSMSETPLVIVGVQRGGPATGLPTKHEQSDLFIAAHGSHGDAPRIILAAENVQDCYDLTIEAFELAEKYQLPVFMLSDGSMGFRTESIARPDMKAAKRARRKHFGSVEEGERFNRYAVTEDNISPVAYPGDKGGRHIATGLEHAESGAPRYDAINRKKMMDKRFGKIANIESEYKQIEIDGDENADLGLIAWGSTIGCVRETVKRLRAKGVKVAAMYPKLVWPIPAKQINEFGKSCKKVMVPEVNFQGQFAELIKSKTDVDPIKYNIYGGAPFTPAEMCAKVEEVIG